MPVRLFDNATFAAVPAKPEELPRWTQGFMIELRTFVMRVTQAIKVLKDGDIETLKLTNQLTEPSDVQNGMIVYTDATGWDPGSGAGIYARIGGAWILL